MLTFHRGRLPGRLHEESGLGLVEVLIGVVVIGVVFSGLAQTLIGSFRSVAISEQRLRATQIASEVIEDIQSLEWDAIGFYDDQLSGPLEVDGHTAWTVVSLGATLPTPVPPNHPLPERTLTRDGVAYEVDTAIVWDDVPPTSPDEMVRKRLQVVVSWTSRARARSVTASSYVALPGSSVQPGFFFMLVASAGAPYQLIDDDGVPVSALGINLPVLFAASTNRDASGVTVAWTDRAGGSADATLSGAAQAWAATHWGATFVNGPTEFSFTASPVGAYATDTQRTTVTFLHDDVEPVSGPTPTSGLTPTGRICLRTLGSRTFSDLVIRVEVQGFQASDGAILLNGVTTWTGQTQSTTTRGVVQDITIPSGTIVVAALGQATFTLTTQRTSALPTAPNLTVFNLPVTFAANAGACS